MTVGAVQQIRGDVDDVAVEGMGGDVAVEVTVVRVLKQCGGRRRDGRGGWDAI